MQDVLLLFLVVISLLAGIAGFASLSQATMGVGLIAMACLAAIYARIVQASIHRDRTAHRNEGAGVG